MANSFEIKYLYEIYPDIDFSEKFVMSQEIYETSIIYESQATKEAWGSIVDSIHAKRLIQTYIKRHYTAKLVLSRNLDVSRLGVGFVTLTTTDSETFVIYDTEIKSTNISGSKNYLIEMNFYRLDDNIINHLSSENALNYKNQTGLSLVNELSFDVIRPSFAVRADITNVSGQYEFEVTEIDEYSEMSAGDDFYFHVKDSSFDNQTHFVGSIRSISAGIITFQFASSGVVANFGESDIVINQEADELPTSSTVETDLLTYSYVIYTLINPVISNLLTETKGISTEDGITENQKFNSKRSASFKIWLTKEELYKIEFLNYALKEDILLTLIGIPTYVPCQVYSIYKEVENRNLIDLYEFDINLLYNNKTVNTNR